MSCEFGISVKGCPEPKHWVHVLNKSAPWLPHKESWKRQCQTCGSFGVATSIKPSEGEQVFEESRANAYKEEKQAEALKRQEERIIAQEREKEEENTRWQENHRNYLNSPTWQRKRQVVLNRDGHVCQACLVEQATEVHHLTYESYNRFPGSEPAWELTSICRRCHEQIHGRC